MSCSVWRARKKTHRKQTYGSTDRQRGERRRGGEKRKDRKERERMREGEINWKKQSTDDQSDEKSAKLAMFLWVSALVFNFPSPRYLMLEERGERERERERERESEMHKRQDRWERIKEQGARGVNWWTFFFSSSPRLCTHCSRIKEDKTRGQCTMHTEHQSILGCNFN